jgi:PiT family inorganic phosphate transporter
MAFAHGSNDVANGIGPMAAIVSIVESGGEMAQKSNLPLWILLTGAVGIVLGLSTLGYRVMQTIGVESQSSCLHVAFPQNLQQQLQW